MSENKRYFFLQLPEDFFSSKRIKKLRRLAGGDTFTIIYLKLQLLSLNSKGLIEWSGLEENLAEELALEIDESAENIEVTLKYLLSCGLAEIRDENDIYLPYVDKMTTSHTASTERSRRSRLKAKELPEFPESVALQHDCNEVTTQDIRDRDMRDKREELKERPPLRGGKKESDEKKNRLSLEQAKKAVSDSELEEETKDALALWMEYKYLDRKDKYSERGTAQVIGSARNCQQAHGAEATAQIIRYSIEREWMGILWEKAGDFKPKKLKTYGHEDIAYKAARALARDVSRRLGVAFPTEDTLQEWAREIAACSEESGNSIEEMAGAMEFSQTDAFWKTVVLDAKTFRRQYVKILAAMQRSEGN